MPTTESEMRANRKLDGPTTEITEKRQCIEFVLVLSIAVLVLGRSHLFAYGRNLSDDITLNSSTSTVALSTSTSTIFHGNVRHHGGRTKDSALQKPCNPSSRACHGSSRFGVSHLVGFVNKSDVASSLV